MTKKEATVKEIMKLKKSRSGTASHVPVLVSLARMFTIETVVEIGSGPISTRLFLDREYFKDLKSLISYETREGWYKKVKSLIDDDERLDYRLISTDVKDIDFNHSGNLLFLDGLKHHRKHCANKMGNNFDFVIQHDTDITEVSFKHKWIYRPKFGPLTVVISNTVDVNKVKWNCKADAPLMRRLCKL